MGGWEGKARGSSVLMEAGVAEGGQPTNTRGCAGHQQHSHPQQPTPMATLNSSNPTQPTQHDTAAERVRWIRGVHMAVQLGTCDWQIEGFVVTPSPTAHTHYLQQHPAHWNAPAAGHQPAPATATTTSHPMQQHHPVVTSPSITFAHPPTWLRRRWRHQSGGRWSTAR
jgi:hypothetical protein